MSPKSFIQFHQEGTKISRVQVRCPERDRDTEKHTNLVLEVTPPDVGHLKIATIASMNINEFTLKINIITFMAQKKSNVA